MNEICKTTLKEINLVYSGVQLEAMLKAWDMYPTLKTDCALTRELKRKARESRMNKILASMHF